MTDRDKPPISTRRGDDGTTTLMGAGRISKADAPIVVLGDIDEASFRERMDEQKAERGIAG